MAEQRVVHILHKHRHAQAVQQAALSKRQAEGVCDSDRLSLLFKMRLFSSALTWAASRGKKRPANFASGSRSFAPWGAFGKQETTCLTTCVVAICVLSSAIYSLLASQQCCCLRGQDLHTAVSIASSLLLFHSALSPWRSTG